MPVLINLRTAVILSEQGPIFPYFTDKFNHFHGLDSGYLKLQNGMGTLNKIRSGRLQDQSIVACNGTKKGGKGDMKTITFV
jgi:hypothetical protein